MDKMPGQRDRTLHLLVAIVGAVVVIAVAVVLTRGATPRLDAATPAGTVQRYTEAVLAGDTDAALALVDPASLSNCFGGHDSTNNLRITLRGTTENGSKAEVAVTFTSTSDTGGFSPAESAQDDRFTLVKRGDVWLITSTPWNVTVCPPEGGTS
ncbi:hypothetical protein [Glaciibacter psychrotolerans]|uniref:Nuclear transport factor 2 family protein n=1 Tax=Glaciibacter psychrotolerans TaxID=670054 RepID=A0A7Z0EEJ0_9MICO|nr:hypothetical protein [Leifsonia psychrotolerans]NYJ20199.1 hypothetical protein [Leifsonia psychrotolerans]